MSALQSFLSDYYKERVNADGADLESDLSTPLTNSVQEIDVLKPLDKENQFFVEWKDVSCFVSTIVRKHNPVLDSIKKLTPFVSKDVSDNEAILSKQQILHNVDGYAASGEILALMGPSGSGKTTLLSAIGGRVPSAMTLSGLITYNGTAFDRSTKNLVGYVAQEDVLYGNLTVYETLYYVALLKLPKTMSREEKIRRVEAVIDALGLNKCRDTLIGTPFRHGVSGGERKRASVGHELLTNPSVLILDEPTSGLDAAMAMHLLVSLRSLSDSGRVVILSIHQPSSRLFHQLQKLMLLADGKLLYFGDSQKASEWFKQKGFPTPDGIHIADFILDIANGDVEGHGMDKQASLRYLIYSMSEYLLLIDAQSSQDGPSLGRALPERTLERSMTQRGFLGRTDQTEEYGASFYEQISILLSRATRVRRLDSFGIHCVSHTIAISILASALFWKRGKENTVLAAADLTSLASFVSAQTQFDAAFRAVGTFPTVMEVLVKERASGMYQLLAFYISESLCDIPLDCSLPMMFLTVVYWCGWCRQTLLDFFITSCAVVLSTLVAQTLGFLIGTTISDPRSAFATATVFMLSMMFVNGFFVKHFPSYLVWLRYLSFTYWSYKIMLQVQFHDKSYLDCGGISKDQLPIEECTPVEDLEDILSLPMDLDRTLWPPFMVLFGMFVILRILVYYVLHCKTTYKN